MKLEDRNSIEACAELRSTAEKGIVLTEEQSSFFAARCAGKESLPSGGILPGFFAIGRERKCEGCV